MVKGEDLQQRILTTDSLWNVTLKRNNSSQMWEIEIENLQIGYTLHQQTGYDVVLMSCQIVSRQLLIE